MPRFVVLRYIIALIAGFIAGFVAVSVGIYISGLIYPMPEGIDLKDQEALAGFFATLPVSALLVALLAHAAGPFVAGIVCSLIAGRFWLPGQIGLGMVFLASGIINLAMLPHPWWFAVVDLLLYVPATLAGAAIGSRLLQLRQTVRKQ